MSVITDANHKEYQRAIKMLNGETKEWAYDIETTGLNVRKDEIIGFGIIDMIGGRKKIIEYGGIRTNKDLPMVERLSILHQELANLLQKYSQEIAA